MKRKVCIGVVVVCVLFASLAGAETFSPVDCLYVDADANGAVAIKGNPVDVAKFTTNVQFCPDQLKADEGGVCDVLRNKYQDFRIVNPETGVFQLNMQSAVERGQVAFNTRSGRLWLLIPNPKVVVGKNLAMEMSHPNSGSEDGKGGTHFVFTGNGYVPKYPVHGGGEACVGGPSIVNLEVPTVKAQPKTACNNCADQVMGGGDSKASVKGNDNDVTPQTVKNQGKIGKTVIKGSHNVVKKKLTNIGVAAKTTGDNSPITITIEKDGNVVKDVSEKKKVTDKNGNTVTEQKIEQKKELKETPSATQAKPEAKKEEGKCQPGDSRAIKWWKGCK